MGVTGAWVEGGGGARLWVDEAGDPRGRPIVFLHGFSQCRLCWRHQLASDLAADFRLVALDLRGHGDSDKPSDPAAYTESKLWADDVAAVIEQRHLDHPVLVGWSYGGLMIADYVSVHGEDAIAGSNWVAAICAVGRPVAPHLGAAFRNLIPGFYRTDVTDSVEALRAFVRLCVHDEPSPEELLLTLGYNTLVPPEVRRALFSRTLDHTAVLGTLTKPVLVTHGGEDPVVLPTMAEHLRSNIAHAELSLYEGVGHSPFAEAPARFNAELRAFVDRC
jgi:pimeloyl-ACP methyl ester carboxylesterase